MQMCCIFFIHSLVEGHLGCFQFLGIINDAAMSIVKKYPCSMIELLLAICPRVVLLSSEVG